MIFDTGIEENLIRATIGGVNLRPLTVTENGKYIAADDGCDGYSEVDVDVKPNLYTPEIITKNGNYPVPAGYDGYGPVTVSVPDRYDEGYEDGKTDGAAEQKKICDEEKATLIEEIDRQDKEIEELKNNQGYTFPDGTAYEDIYSFVGGAGTITDITLGIYIKTTVTDNENIRSISVNVYDTDGNMLTGLGGGGFGSLGATTAKVDYISVDATTGTYDVCISFDGYAGAELKHYTKHQTGTYWKLVGFGSSDHKINAKN